MTARFASRSGAWSRFIAGSIRLYFLLLFFPSLVRSLVPSSFYFFVLSFIVSFISSLFHSLFPLFLHYFIHYFPLISFFYFPFFHLLRFSSNFPFISSPFHSLFSFFSYNLPHSHFPSFAAHRFSLCYFISFHLPFPFLPYHVSLHCFSLYLSTSSLSTLSNYSVPCFQVSLISPFFPTPISLGTDPIAQPIFFSTPRVLLGPPSRKS